MNYKNFLFIILFFAISNCTSVNLDANKKVLLKDNFSNKGFTLVYDDNLFYDKIISSKLDERSLVIFQKNLKKNTQVKITNILNNKTLIVKVGKKTKYPHFNNSVISKRIASELNLNLNEPYVQITAIPENSLFIAKKAKTYDEEKKVANKMPVKSINIDDLNDNDKIKNKDNSNNINNFSYHIKIADFFFKDTAKLMIERIKSENKIESIKMIKISEKKYRVYLGPYEDISTLQKSYYGINILNFENIEIIKND